MKNLLKFRNERGWSVRDLAVEAGVHYVSLVRLENGKFDPRLSTLRKLARALEVTVCDLIDDQPKQRRSYGTDKTKGRLVRRVSRH